MSPSDELAAIWDSSQFLLPLWARRPYDGGESFCWQEKMLRDHLRERGCLDAWNLWRRHVRAAVYSNRVAKYGSAPFAMQRRIEYLRRADDWENMLLRILYSQGMKQDERLLDVGAHDGEEVAGLPFRVTCVDPSVALCQSGRMKYPAVEFVVATADAIPLRSRIFSAYVSLRTWCVAGVLADEALDEAVRILEPHGILIVSLPLAFGPGEPTFDNMRTRRLLHVACWIRELLSKRVCLLNQYAAPEDFFLYGRLK